MRTSGDNDDELDWSKKGRQMARREGRGRRKRTSSHSCFYWTCAFFSLLPPYFFLARVAQLSTIIMKFCEFEAAISWARERIKSERASDRWRHEQDDSESVCAAQTNKQGSPSEWRANKVAKQISHSLDALAKSSAALANYSVVTLTNRGQQFVEDSGEWPSNLPTLRQGTLFSKNYFSTVSN